jgi:hypothetical protein
VEPVFEDVVRVRAVVPADALLVLQAQHGGKRLRACTPGPAIRTRPEKARTRAVILQGKREHKRLRTSFLDRHK